MKLTSGKIAYCYDLMDAAYDAVQIWEQSKELDHVPIIDRNPRGKEGIPMAPHEAVRNNERTSVERSYGRVKDELGGRCVRVRGPDKVMMCLIFSIVAFFADQLIKITGC